MTTDYRSDDLNRLKVDPVDGNADFDSGETLYEFDAAGMRTKASELNGQERAVHVHLAVRRDRPAERRYQWRRGEQLHHRLRVRFDEQPC